MVEVGGALATLDHSLPARLMTVETTVRAEGDLRSRDVALIHSVSRKAVLRLLTIQSLTALAGIVRELPLGGFT